MAALEDFGEVISTDVLVVGGGVGGLTMAIKAKEANPNIDVLLVEKQTAGWAGKSTKIGGILPSSDLKMIRISFWIFRSAPPASF